MLTQPLSSNMLGSHTPQLEGAPCSQMHESRMSRPVSGLLPDAASSTEEKGPLHEAVTEADG